MNIQSIKTVWRSWKKPSRATLEQLEKAGAKIDYWPDYLPRESRAHGTSPKSLESSQWDRVTKTLTAHIGL